MKIALFGGSFDPVHKEHVRLVKEAIKGLSLDKLIVVPAGTPPHKQGRRLAPAADRLAMCRIAFADVEKAEVSDFEIAQGGTNVSGGQRQRLSIARALVKKPEIFIFDDTFSALDFKTDASLRKALGELCAQTKCTVLLVAQRISSIMHADRIVVLDQGSIVGIGTHEELLKSNKIYAEVYYSQVKGSDENAESAQGGEENGN